MSCGRHWYFFCTWHLHLIFVARFSNMPYFRQSLSRNAITKFYQIWYIAKYCVFMLIIFQVDKQSVSIRFCCVWKKSHYFWTGVYNISQSHGLSLFTKMDHNLRATHVIIQENSDIRYPISRAIPHHSMIINDRSAHAICVCFCVFVHCHSSADIIYSKWPAKFRYIQGMTAHPIVFTVLLKSAKVHMVVWW